MVLHARTFIVLVASLVVAAPLAAADLSSSLKQGSVELQSAGPLAFGPEGILFIGDPEAATIYAVGTGDKQGDVAGAKINVQKLDQKVAAALGTKADDILINDLAVNPASGNVYLSVSRGRGPDASVVILKVNGKGKISEVSLDKVPMAKTDAAKAPAPDAKDRRGRPLRPESITDLAYVDGRLLVAGLSSEEFSSALRSLSFPFADDSTVTSVEIFHGAHGRVETASPVRTFTTYEIAKEPHVLAAYTCTPLVKFPLDELEPGKKIVGVTIAELGNHNRPLDMFVYTKDGQDYILMANSARGVMKVKTAGAERADGITKKIDGTAGQTYETIESLQGVEQLDKLNASHAVILVRNDDGVSIQTIDLP